MSLVINGIILISFLPEPQDIVQKGLAVHKYPAAENHRIEFSLQSGSCYAAVVKGAAEHWKLDLANYTLPFVCDTFRKEHSGKWCIEILFNISNIL